MSQPIISISGVSKRFGAVTAIDDISIDIKAGEIFALLGPSGCGKSTLLRMLAGFEHPSDGAILLDGKDLTRLPPNRRPINMVFQSYAVFPHMTVERNVAYGLEMERVKRSEIRSRVAHALEQVQLDGLGDRRTDQLSGGQRQRVAVARALVKRPRVLLLDEPLSALDAKLRDAMRLELVKLQEMSGITFIIVTHDQAEAMALADRIAVLEGGRLRQVDTPRNLYNNPVDAFVADFIGNVHSFDVTKIDLVEGRMRVQADVLGQLMIDKAIPEGLLPGVQTGRGRVLTIRPERIGIKIGDTYVPGHLALRGTVGDIAFQGQHSIVEVRVNESRSISAIVDDDTAKELDNLSADAVIQAHWAVADMHLLESSAR